MSTRARLLASASAALLAILSVAIPLYVIRPFRPQGQGELAFALAVRNSAQIISAVCVLITLYLLLRTWKAARIAPRLGLLIASVVTIAAASLTHINIFEKMFHPYATPAFAAAGDAPIDPDDKVLSLTLSGETHAFPIRTLGYHHIVNDILGGIPIAATYCTLCHTGILYDRRLDGKTLYFTLAGINNGNALLRDRETGSIWQQSTGEAIFGPMRGRHLTLIPADELTFALWQKEQPHGLILRPDQPNQAQYDPKDWEAHVARTHVVVDTSATGIDPHTLMLGVTVDGHSKAFTVQSILDARLIQDRFDGHPVLLLAGPDHASIRAFTPSLPGDHAILSFVLGKDDSLTDTGTSSTWDFSGCATSGTLRGRCLPPIEAHKDFWFDWYHHHTDTRIRRD